MSTAHLDVETTGINLNGVPSNDPRQPHIVSLSAVLDDDFGYLRKVMSVIIQPQGYEIDERLEVEDPKNPGKMIPTAFSIHGITNEVAQVYGIPLEQALRQFALMLEMADTFSSYNVHFDAKFVKIGCAQLPEDAEPSGDAIRAMLETKQSICTMESAAMHLIGKKRMKLKDAYFSLFKEETQAGSHHGSHEDVMAHRRIFHELRKRGAPMEVKSLAAKEYDTPYVAA